MKIKIFRFLSKLTTAYKIESQSFNFFWSWKYIYIFRKFLCKIEQRNFKFNILSHFACINSRKNFGVIDVFFCESTGE